MDETGSPAPRVGVSHCLLGAELRFNAGHKRDRFVEGELGRHFAFVPVCPEYEVGMGVPREPVHLSGDPAAPRMRGSRSGADWTESINGYARDRVEALAAAGLDGFVLKKGSPSCGLERVKVYGADGAPKGGGGGLFARALAERLPRLPMEEEGRLNDAHLRERFVERVFAHHRWRAFRRAEPGPGDLVAFHAREKLALLAHDPAGYKELGRLVARAGDAPCAETLDAYGARYLDALAKPATRGRHANVLEHLLGHLRESLDAADRAEIADTIEQYRIGHVPLVVPLTLLKHHFRRHPQDWVLEQTYLDPYPADLMLRNHV